MNKQTFIEKIKNTVEFDVTDAFAVKPRVFSFTFQNAEVKDGKFVFYKDVPFVLTATAMYAKWDPTKGGVFKEWSNEDDPVEIEGATWEVFVKLLAYYDVPKHYEIEPVKRKLDEKKKKLLEKALDALEKKENQTVDEEERLNRRQMVFSVNVKNLDNVFVDAYVQAKPDATWVGFLGKHEWVVVTDEVAIAWHPGKGGVVVEKDGTKYVDKWQGIVEVLDKVLNGTEVNWWERTHNWGYEPAGDLLNS